MKGTRRNNRKWNNTAEKNRECDMKKIMFGYKIPLQLPKDFHTRRVPVILPVSTRGIGFVCQSIFDKLTSACILEPDMKVWPLYRVALLQLEIRIRESRSSAIIPRSREEDFQNPHDARIITEAYVDKIKAMGLQFACLTNLIHAVGHFEYKGSQYVSRILKLQSNWKQYDPVLVTFSTLRRYVEVLSDPETPLDIRQYFYERNPLPGADWGHPGNSRDFPILLNPDDIMPESYDINTLSRDMHHVQSLVDSRISRVLPNMFSDQPQDYQAPGNTSLFVSNEAGKVRCSNTSGFVGDLDKFWSPVQISNSEAIIGVWHLTGELAREECYKQSIRSQSSAVQSVMASSLSLMRSFVQMNC